MRTRGIVLAVGFVLTVAAGQPIGGAQASTGTDGETGRNVTTLTVHDVGEYANWPWDKPGTSIEPGSRDDRVRDLMFSVARVDLDDDMTEKFLTHWRNVAAWGKQQGKKLLPRVQFWDGRERIEGPMRDVEVYWGRLDRFLGAMDLRGFVGIVLASENAHYGGRPKMLAELYRRVKSKHDVDVWQWYSPRTAVPGSGGWIPSDGWVIDPYMVPKKEFRPYLRKYLIAGVPVVVMPWAAVMDNPPHGGEQDKAYFEFARGQLEVAVEFGLPAAFFWIRGTTTHFRGDRSASDTLMDKTNQRVWAHIERVRRLPADFAGSASADIAHVGPVSLKPLDAGGLEYRDNFSTSKCVDDASVTGFRDLMLDGTLLRARGFNGRTTRATLSYRFACPDGAKTPQVSLTARINANLKGSVEVGLSPDGKDWSHSTRVEQAGEHGLAVTSDGLPGFESLTSFWVRIRLDGQSGSPGKPPVSVRDLHVQAVQER